MHGHIYRIATSFMISVPDNTMNLFFYKNSLRPEWTTNFSIRINDLGPFYGQPSWFLFCRIRFWAWLDKGLIARWLKLAYQANWTFLWGFFFQNWHNLIYRNLVNFLRSNFKLSNFEMEYFWILKDWQTYVLLTSYAVWIEGLELILSFGKDSFAQENIGNFTSSRSQSFHGSLRHSRARPSCSLEAVLRCLRSVQAPPHLARGT